MVETITQPWGKEVSFAQTPLYSGKILYLRKNTRTSLHYHEHADKTHFVLSGKVKLIVDNQEHILEPNLSFNRGHFV